MGNIGQSLGENGWLTMTLATAGIASLTLADRNTSEYFRNGYSKSGFLDFANYFGDKKLVFSVSGGLYGISHLTSNERFKDATFTSFQSVFVSTMVFKTLKFVAGRARPDKAEGPYKFRLMQGDYSFPSGHSATAFAFMTPWVFYYPNVFTYGLMAIPAGTAIARIAKGKHWLSDVVAGSSIGLVLGYYFSRQHLNLSDDKISIYPVAGSESLALNVAISF